jgi:hypothetical protein
MKKYTIEVIIYEGNDEFWEEIGDKTGCDEVLDLAHRAFSDYGFWNGEQCEIKFKKFEVID